MASYRNDALVQDKERAVKQLAEARADEVVTLHLEVQWLRSMMSANLTNNPPMAMSGSMVGSNQPVAAGMSQLERDIQTMVSHDGVRMLGRSLATRPNVHTLAHLLSVLMAHPWIATDNTTFSHSRGVPNS